MIMNGIRTGVCPREHFLSYRLDMERNGYKILSTEEPKDGEDNVIFTYQKVTSAFKMIHQPGDTSGDET